MNERGERKEIPYRVYRKKVVGFLKVQGLYSSKILGFKDSSRNPLLGFQKKVVAIRNGQGCPLKQKKSIFYRGQNTLSLLLFMNYSNTKYRLGIRMQILYTLLFFVFSFQILFHNFKHFL